MTQRTGATRTALAVRTPWATGILQAFRTALVAAVVLPASGRGAEGPPPEPAAAPISLADGKGALDAFFFREIDLPAGKIRHAWAMISARHEYVLWIGGAEASRSRYGRVASAFRLAEEVEDLSPFLKAGARNVLLFKAHIWDEGPPDRPTEPMVRLEGEVVIEDPSGQARIVPLATGAAWVGSREAPADGKSRPPTAGPVKVDPDPGAGRLEPRIPKDRRQEISPDIPPPLPAAVLADLPPIAEMSDWSQQVVRRDPAQETERLLGIFPCRAVAERYARAIASPPTHMGDSYSINLVSVGNGWVWTALGSYPFHNTGVVAGPEYQYPVQWDAGSTFQGDDLRLLVDGQEVGLSDQWLWKIRKTDVVVTAAADPGRTLVFYTVTFAPPDLKALVRIYGVANASPAPLGSVRVRQTIGRCQSEGRTLTATVRHEAMKAADANVRAMTVGVLEEDSAAASAGPEGRGSLEIDFGPLGPGKFQKRLVHRVFSLESVAGKPVPSDAQGTLAAVRARGYGLLDDAIRSWRDYNASTVSLEAAGPWGRRAADFIDDQKMLVQSQQFARTGAVGPMWFFSDQWIRDACGPILAFLCTGKLENARRAIDYSHTASVANRIILNWVGMDVDIGRAWPPVDDWSAISVHAGGGDHVSAEVPSWLILQHHWYWKATGDLEPIQGHWDYLRRLYFGQFDNPKDKIHRPDFKIPFHGDETYIYSGGEALWEGRYDLSQSSYPGGNIWSADSSFELVAAGDALVEMGRAAGKDISDIAAVNPAIRAATERYYWMEDLGFYAQGMSVLCDGQRSRHPMANILANVLWCGYARSDDPKAVSTTLRLMEYLMEDTGVFNPIVGYDVTVGMLQGQCLRSLAAIDHPWAEKAFHALFRIAGDTAEYTEWMAPGRDFRTMYRANRLRPWEGGINLDAALYFLTGLEPDAPARGMTLTPRLPGGELSPIRWDSMTLRGLPLGRGRFDLTVADDGAGRRTYTLASALPEEVTVTLRCLIPLGRITGVEVDGKAAAMEPRVRFGQGLAAVRSPLRPGKVLTVTASYRPRSLDPVKVDLKDFRPPEPRFGASDIVIFGAARPGPDGKSLASELGRRHKVQALDASLPADPAEFQAALLDGEGLKARMLILAPGAMANRKQSYWRDPRFDRIVGEFLRRGGAVLEAGSGLVSSRWLEKTLAPATFQVDPSATGYAVALDAANPAMDRSHRWLQEMNVGEAGKWSAYWEGWFDLPYLEGGVVIRDHYFTWGEQEQPHGAMQFNLRCAPGKDHLVRLRTTPGAPRRGFTLQGTEDGGRTWTDLETAWAPAPQEGKNGWVDVDLVLPARYAAGPEVTIRIRAPKGSYGGIGYEPERLASTGAARIWIREGLEKPPALAGMDCASVLAGRLALPDRGLVGHCQGRIRSAGFASPCRILGESAAAAVILKRVGKGLYAKSELAVEASFPLERMAGFVEALMDPAAREALPAE